LPTNIPIEFKFLGPYLKTATNPPPHAIVYSATNTDSFFAALNNYALQLCRAGQQYDILLSFWARIITDAVAGQLDLARSGRREVQRQRQEDVLLKILPVLRDGFSIHGVPDLTMACYTLSMVLSTKGNLADNVIDSLMDSVAETISAGNPRAAFLCLYLLCRHRSEWSVPPKTCTKIMRVNNVGILLHQIAEEFEIDEFVLALHNASLRSLQKKRTYAEKITFVETLIRLRVWGDDAQARALNSTVQKIEEIAGDDPVDRAAKARLLDVIFKLSESEGFEEATRKAISSSGADPTKFEADLQMLLKEPAVAEIQEDTGMGDEPRAHIPEIDTVGNMLSHIPLQTVDERSFLSHTPSSSFEPLTEAFLVACRRDDNIQKFQS
jgi:U3 small nucleolar RNA-associated protein 10